MGTIGGGSVYPNLASGAGNLAAAKPVRAQNVHGHDACLLKVNRRQR